MTTDTPSPAVPAADASRGEGALQPTFTGHEDRIERLQKPFYIRWTCGPNYERAFLCVEDGEPDMRDFATVSFGMAELFKAGMGAMSLIEAQEATTADIGVVGPVDGTNEKCPEGAYFRLVVTRGDEDRRQFLISRGAAEALRDELIGALDKAASHQGPRW